MPPKKQKQPPPKVPSKARQKGSVSKAQSILNLVKNVGLADSARCAFQLLNADRSSDQNDFVDAPVSDSSPVHVFVTETSLSVNAINRTDSAKSYISIKASPCPQSHLRYATSFDNGGNITASLPVNVEGYSQLSSLYDDLRCCAMMMHVKCTALEEKLNGIEKVFCFNPESYSLNESNIDSLPGLEYPPNKLHYARVPWVPARPEIDHAFVSPTATANVESTAVSMYGIYAPTATGQMSVRVRVFAIWAGRLLPDSDHVATPKVYAIDVPEFERNLQAQLLKVPLWNQERIMARDDGPISTVVQDAQMAWGGAKKLFDSGSSWSDRLSGGLDLVRSVGSIGSVIAGLFGVADRVVSRLAGLSDEELRYAQKLLLPGRNPRGVDCPSSEDVRQLQERRRFVRKHQTRLSRTHQVFDVCPYAGSPAMDIEVAHDWLEEVLMRCLQIPGTTRQRVTDWNTSREAGAPSPQVRALSVRSQSVDLAERRSDFEMADPAV